MKKNAFRDSQGRADPGELRSHLGLTQQEFATLLGFSTVTVSRWERDENQPDNERYIYLDLLAKAALRCDGGEIVRVLKTAQDDTSRLVQLVRLAGE